MLLIFSLIGFSLASGILGITYNGTECGANVEMAGYVELDRCVAIPKQNAMIYKQENDTSVILYQCTDDVCKQCEKIYDIPMYQCTEGAPEVGKSMYMMLVEDPEEIMKQIAEECESKEHNLCHLYMIFDQTNCNGDMVAASVTADSDCQKSCNNMGTTMSMRTACPGHD